MYVVPCIDRHRMVERIAERAAVKGFVSAAGTLDHEALAKSTGLDETMVRDVASGLHHDEAIGKIAAALGAEPADIAPLINLRDPDRRDRLPPEGRDVPATEFWHRRIAEGGVMVVNPPVAVLTPRNGRRAAAEPAVEQAS